MKLVKDILKCGKTNWVTETLIGMLGFYGRSVLLTDKHRELLDKQTEIKNTDCSNQSDTVKKIKICDLLVQVT